MKRSQPGKSTGRAAKGPGEIRIIGGKWRGRRLCFTPQVGLRPTLDRFRETLFNWLMFEVEGARCLDLFAGSGALGLEALSRGARQVDFVDASAQVCRDIRQHLHNLQSERGRVWHSQAEPWLKAHADLGPYDLIFLDPPFHQDLLQSCIYLLQNNGFLAPGCKVYLEAEAAFSPARLPPEWKVHRQKSAGDKIFLLLIPDTQSPVPKESTT